ncbi:MAG: HAD hydrolase-like protein [Candidatus Dojkabacteria bacterium]|nr:HAD hydrolase-like protein [Candidatus Dojkabacteria bacterium]
MNYSKYVQFWIKGVFGRVRILTENKKSVFEIDFQNLKAKTDLVIFDFDDTLVEFGGRLNSDMSDLLKRIIDMGYKVAVFSNCTKQRTAELNKVLTPLGIYNVVRSDKPSPEGFIDAMKHFDVSPERTIAVGDKIGTEMYGAYLAGIRYRILVEPFSYVFGGRKASIYHRILREVEKIAYRIADSKIEN